MVDIGGLLNTLGLIAISEKIEKKLISAAYVTIGKHLGDIFTKVLNRVRVDYIFNKLSVINVYAPTGGGVLSVVYNRCK